MMKQNIVQNGGSIILILHLLINIGTCIRSENTFGIQELCSQRDTFNIEPGDTFVLSVTSNFSPNSDKQKWYRKTKRRCNIEFRTSDHAAHFEVAIYNMSIPSCKDCRCNNFEISSLSHHRKYCGVNETELYFISKSNSVSISFHHWFEPVYEVFFSFEVQRNSYIITGAPNLGHEERHLKQGNFIETPYFPKAFPSSYKAEYILKSDYGGHVMLQFLDFQISNRSFIEVKGDEFFSRFYGHIFRPPVIVSKSNSLSVKFESRSVSEELGFRALCSFVKTDYFMKPFTDCGGSISDHSKVFGIKIHKVFGMYDCVWIFNPFWGVSNLYLSISALAFKNVAPPSSLEIREGRHSKSLLVKEVKCETEYCNDVQIEASVSGSMGFYVRFIGYLEVDSAVNFSFSTYHSRNCSSYEFACLNNRCLHHSLLCDGIRHCPDGSDEVNCSGCSSDEFMCPDRKCVKLKLKCDGIEDCMDGKDESNCPNPKSESSEKESEKSSLKSDQTRVSTVIIFIGCFGFFLVFVALIFVYKKYKSVSQHEVQTTEAEEMIAIPFMNSIGANDNPPSYEDFVKSCDMYPPLLYTRADNCLKPVYSRYCSSVSTLPKTRYHSDISIDLKAYHCNSYAKKGHNFGATSDSVVKDNMCNRNIPKRSHSLDSKLNSLWKEDSCHLFLSIIRPLDIQIPKSQIHVNSHSLPQNYKFSLLKMREEQMPCVNSNEYSCTNQSYTNVRRFTWSFVPQSSNPKVVTVVKGRCHSDPCHSISIHCSLDT